MSKNLNIIQYIHIFKISVNFDNPTKAENDDHKNAAFQKGEEFNNKQTEK